MEPSDELPKLDLWLEKLRSWTKVRTTDPSFHHVLNQSDGRCHFSCSEPRKSRAGKPFPLTSRHLYLLRGDVTQRLTNLERLYERAGRSPGQKPLCSTRSPLAELELGGEESLPACAWEETETADYSTGIHKRKKNKSTSKMIMEVFSGREYPRFAISCLAWSEAFHWASGKSTASSWMLLEWRIWLVA
ncbi:hypothetical protein EYF80_016783 [Liparis tanakae]|uniref:Uncharacterized protein n=1 Tax=Liparis tanakae TaxID=230148 RepID=A0A4Z2I738_9TELE|nr:hypothetical protein EYF80_016783 [Liparis tanakae]